MQHKLVIHPWPCTNLAVLTFHIAHEESDPHWISQARDLQVILAAAETGLFADGDHLREDGSQELYEDLYRDMLMAGYSRDESFKQICGVDKYQMQFAVTLSQLAIFLSKRSLIDNELAQWRQPAPQHPIPGKYLQDRKSVV